MEQQTILKNIPKGEYFTAYMNQDCLKISRIIDGRAKPTGIIVESINGHKAHPTAEAICIAVNNTYAKGINPESVEKMREMLERSFKWISSASQERASILHDIEESLTAAKL